MQVIGKAAAILALVAMPSAARAQTSTCLTQAETAAMIGYVLPDLVAGVRDKCKATLPPKSFLSSRSAELEARYRTQADGLWPEARVAFVKMVGEDEVMRKLPDSALRPFLTAAFATTITDDLKPKDCVTADGLVEALAPLPPENLARLIGIIIAADGKGSDAAGKHDFQICA
jgi:hypothetical protein